MATFSNQQMPSDIQRRINVNQLIGSRQLVRPLINGTSAEAKLNTETAINPRRVKAEADFVFTPPHSVPVIKGFSKEQLFEGTVIAVNQEEGTFTARLVDLTEGSPDEEGEFALDELNGDEYLAVPGALFTWVVGLQMRGTTRQRVSDIRFRRLPAFTETTIRKAQAEAIQLAQILSAQDASEAFTARPR